MDYLSLLSVGLFVLVAVVLIVRLLRPREEKPWMQVASCPKCGWKGQTSRHAGRCPVCNTPIGEQRVRNRS